VSDWPEPAGSSAFFRGSQMLAKRLFKALWFEEPLMQFDEAKLLTSGAILLWMLYVGT